VHSQGMDVVEDNVNYIVLVASVESSKSLSVEEKSESESIGSILIGSYISPLFFSLAVYQPCRTIQKHLVIKASSPSFRQRVCCLILFELGSSQERLDTSSLVLFLYIDL
jgi:hypothetical protein